MAGQRTAEEIAADYLWQRDQCRAKCQRLERENERLKMLLRYAEEAIWAEYSLRTPPCLSDL